MSKQRFAIADFPAGGETVMFHRAIPAACRKALLIGVTRRAVNRRRRISRRGGTLNIVCSNRVLNGAVPRTQSCAKSGHSRCVWSSIDTTSTKKKPLSIGHADLFVRNFLKVNFFVTTGLANGSVSFDVMRKKRDFSGEEKQCYAKCSSH